MPRRSALPEDTVPFPSGRFRRRRSAGGRDRGQESSNRLSRNALSAGRPLAASPRARSFRAKSTPTSTTDVPAGSSSASRCSNPGSISLASIAAISSSLRSSVANGPAIAGGHLVLVGWSAGFGHWGGRLLVGFGHDAPLLSVADNSSAAAAGEPRHFCTQPR